jgi:serine protease DegQ
VIVSSEGYLLTNNHVIDGADEIQVQLSDGRTAKARLVGTDPESDIAVLKVDLDRLPVVSLGRIDQVVVGDAVLAIGNPFNVGQTVTSGIVSALDAAAWACPPSRTSSRPTRRSTPATPAAR